MDTMKDFINGKMEGKAKSRMTYYYIWAIVNGRIYVDGSYSNEQDALKFGDNNIKQYFEIVGLPTRDFSVATKMIKEQYTQQVR